MFIWSLILLIGKAVSDCTISVIISRLLIDMMNEVNRMHMFFMTWLLHICRLNINKSAMCTCFLSLNQYSLDISPIGNVILQVFIQIVYKQSVDFFEENIIHNSRCLIVNDNVIANKDMIFSFDYHSKLTFKSFVTKCVFLFEINDIFVRLK